MADYFIGTAGWSYADWEGIVYPQKKVRGFHALIFLAQYINIIEINSTFYRPPVIQISLSWIKKVENYPEFLFAVKLHQVFTHERKGFTQKDVDNFKLGIEPLRAKERLASILIQFPWSFASTTSNNAYLIKLFKSFSDYPLALEVRHSSWDSPDFYKLLSEYNVGFCNIDQPIFRNSIKPSSISTNPEFSYVRLHGRNYKNWFKQDAGRDERYNYLYTKEELEDWIERIKDLGNQSSKVYVITNNHYRGQALANALQIKNLITGEKLDVPPLLVEQYPVLKELAKKISEGQLGLFDEK
ncbi:MAG: DUF72 domain-containing protein [Candidatus Aminicenantes bacterium]|nr:DUF72 domain-containing protein [Candidatus Aminicenantes bacterium]